MKKGLVGLFDQSENGTFDKVIFHDFNRKFSLSEDSGLDTETQNSYFGLMLRDLKCDLQDLEPSEIPIISERVRFLFGT